MRKFKKLLMVPLLAALALTPMATGVNAAVKPDASDLVILQNVPEMDTRIGEDGLELTALRVYGDGHFVKTDDVEWTTSNGNVATVDGAGNVTVTGKPGKTFIGVKDGDMSDRIAVQAKPDPGARTGKGKPPVVA